MKIRFLADYVTKNAPADRESFKAGEVREMSDNKARHYTLRGVAEEVKEAKPTTSTSPPKSESKDPKTEKPDK